MSGHGEHESHAGITAEIRARAGAWMDDKMKQNDERLADRLDAAHKRERGNSAALREAVEKVIEIANKEWDASRETSAMWEIWEICKAALAAPARNCDVGTADDWLARFSAVCERCSGSDCDHRQFKDEEVCDCFARWLQMPYKEGETK